ncbi:hypothetical protein HMPREF0063_10752 [Aeromicrobium marinum DSM 15272]|uniref:DUF418 domain-containing protein n=1 Tax=Aeromicrobium marinum DSM 15272 TaxID=585531 RepID=E2S9W2_9ACTN|nr:hypothetical protein HMPREF0063_10752 [Aeromicrobium marinum DSM 15272]
MLPDVARGVAITAMLIAHAGPFVSGAGRPALDTIARLSDLASPLFSLVMGMAAAIVLARDRHVPGFLWQQAVRGLVLIGLGAWMDQWGTWIAIVLSNLGITLLVGSLVLVLGAWVTAVTAVAVLVVSQPLLESVARAAGPLDYYATDLESYLLRWTALDPYYRLVNLLPFFLVGALLARWGYAGRPDVRVSGAMVVAGVVGAAVLTTSRFPAPEARVSGTYADTAHDVTQVLVAVGVIGLALAWRPTAAVLRPFAPIGVVALSLYVAHGAVVALLADTVYADTGGRPAPGTVDWTTFVVFVGGFLLLSWAWGRWIGRAPIEWALGFVTRRRVRA